MTELDPNGGIYKAIMGNMHRSSGAEAGAQINHRQIMLNTGLMTYLRWMVDKKGFIDRSEVPLDTRPYVFRDGRIEHRAGVRNLQVDGKWHRLSPSLNDTLLLLTYPSPGRIVTYEHMHEEMWPSRFDPEAATLIIRTNIWGLRKLVEPDRSHPHIQTVRGLGMKYMPKGDWTIEGTPPPIMGVRPSFREEFIGLPVMESVALTEGPHPNGNGHKVLPIRDLSELVRGDTIKNSADEVCSFRGIDEEGWVLVELKRPGEDKFTARVKIETFKQSYTRVAKPEAQ